MLYAQDLIEVLCAAHLSALVESPYEERGGIMLIGPPGVLKSTFLEELDRQYSDALSLTDLNAKALTTLRDRISGGTIRTLVFPEFAKLYERKDDTAANLEGSLRAIAAEGFRSASFEDQQINRIRARALVLGAMTPATQTRRFTAWEESGFNRRFLWPLIRLAEPGVLEDAVMEWRRIDFRVKHVPQAPLSGGRIPNSTTRDERMRMRVLCKYQPGASATQQVQLMVKILAVLKWWYDQIQSPRNPMEVMESFGEALGKDGAELMLRPIPASVRRRVRQKEYRVKLHEAGRVLSRQGQRTKAAKKKRRKVKR